MGSDRVHDAGPGWLVLLRGGCEVVRAWGRGDVRLFRVEDVRVTCVCCRVRCGGGVFLWVIGPDVICVRGFDQQGTAWGMCILLAGIGVRSSVHALHHGHGGFTWLHIVCALRVIASTVYFLGKKRAHKLCILIILKCLFLP